MPQLLKLSGPRAHALQQRKPLQREAHASQLESSPHLPQLEKNPHSNEDPAQQKKKKKRVLHNVCKVKKDQFAKKT